VVNQELAALGTIYAEYSPKEVICMHYFVLGIGAGAILFIGRSTYLRVVQWSRSNRLRGAKACLEAVHDTLDSLAKSNPKAKSRK
jgi:hypothetical protein